MDKKRHHSSSRLAGVHPAIDISTEFILRDAGLNVTAAGLSVTAIGAKTAETKKKPRLSEELFASSNEVVLFYFTV